MLILRGRKKVVFEQIILNKRYELIEQICDLTVTWYYCMRARWCY